VQAQAELRALAPEFRKANTLWVPAPEYGAEREVAPLQERIVSDVRARMLILLGAVGFVLLIACANVANLLLARAVARQKEVAVRSALGAGRRRIVQQFLTESALLGTLGGALGLLFAVWGVQVLVGALPADTPRIAEIGIDRSVLGFTLAVSTLSSLLFGLVPAFRSSRTDVQAALKRGERGSSAAHHRLSGALVVAEFGLAVVLVIGAGLLIRSFTELVRVDPGFRTESIITARITPPSSRYADDARRRAFYADVLERVGALPGVKSVDAVSRLPLAGGFTGSAFEVEGKPYVPGTAAPVFEDRRITPGYPQTMGMPLLEGRALTDADREGMPRVALINETMARQFWPGEDPVGKRFKEVWLKEWTTVVGVVGDVKSQGLAGKVEPEAYRPLSQLPAHDLSLVVRTSNEPMALAPLLRTAVAGVDAHVPVSEIRTAETIVSSSVAGARFTMLLLAAFAAVALVLAAVGIYGVISYAVGRRTREIGVRVALGAPGGEVLRMVLRQALELAGIGAAIGVAAAFATTRVLQSLLFGVSATDPLILLTVPLLLVGVALLASYVPARRATKVDPMMALRAE
jgi:putative ABC transport system permease protein